MEEQRLDPSPVWDVGVIGSDVSQYATILTPDVCSYFTKCAMLGLVVMQQVKPSFGITMLVGVLDLLIVFLGRRNKYLDCSLPCGDVDGVAGSWFWSCPTLTFWPFRV